DPLGHLATVQRACRGSGDGRAQRDRCNRRGTGAAAAPTASRLRRRCGRGGATAGVVARPLDRSRRKRRGGRPELTTELGQLGDAPLDLDRLRRHQVAQLVLHRGALICVPRLDQTLDLLERAPELLGSRNQTEPLHIPVVIYPVSRGTSGGRGEDAFVLVEPQGGRSETRQVGGLCDSVSAVFGLSSAHGLTVRLQPDSKVKRILVISSRRLPKRR